MSSDWLVRGVGGKIVVIVLPPLRKFFVPRCTVGKNFPNQLWFQRYLEFHCDDCGCDTGFRSRRRTFSERFLLPVFLLQPVRCAECFRRDYRLLFVPVKDRLTETATRKQAAPVPRPDRNVA